MVVIRSARLSDAGEVYKLSCDLNISRDSKKPSGFVEYPDIGVSGFRERIKRNPHFLVAEENGRLIGFVSGFTHSRLAKLDSFKEDEIASHLLSKYPAFLYIDQLAVHPDFQRSKVAMRLGQELLSKTKRTLFSAVATHPHDNIPSRSLLGASGFSKSHDLDAYGLKFAIYKK